MQDDVKQDLNLGVPFEMAREIMGKKAFWGLEEALGRFKVKMAKENQLALKQVPFTEEMLLRSRKDHILAIKVGLSPHDLYLRSGFEHLIDKAWSQHPLAKIKGNIGWSLVRTEVFPGSLGGRLSAQKTLLGKDDRVPSVGTLINAIVAYRILNGVGIFLKTFARCVDSTEELYRLSHCYHVSRTKNGQLYAGHFSEEGREPRLGLASRKKTIPELLPEGLPIL